MHNRLEMVRIFLAVVDAGSFKAAASQLSTSPQKVTRAIQELERVMGEALFHRSTRHIQITDTGKALVTEARAALSGFDRLFARTDADAESQLAGRVGITAPHAIATRFLPQYLAQLSREYPLLRIDLSVDDEVIDAVTSSIDIGIRVGTVSDRRFIARTVADVRLMVVASPELVRRTGAPSSLAELQRCPLSVLLDRRSRRPWPWMFSGDHTWVPGDALLVCDDAETELGMVLQGAAFAQVPDYLAAPYLARGALVEVLQPLAPAPMKLILYRTRPGPPSRRVRLVYDHLMARFGDPQLFPGGAPVQ